MKDSQTAPSLGLVKPSLIRRMADMAFGMDDVLKLHFGESNMPTPTYIKDAAKAALDEGFTYYTENAGLPSLRGAISEKYFSLHNVNLSWEHEIVVTASGVQALNVAIRCSVDPGDQALILTPNWPNAAEICHLYGAVPVEIPFARGESKFRPDFDSLAKAVTPRTRRLVYTSPSNPLGWVATEDEQRRLLEFCRNRGLWLIADEVYERIYFRENAGERPGTMNPVAPSILRLCSRDDAVTVVQSFSKTYRMTGWRLGWLVGRRDLAGKAAQMNEFIVSHAPSMAQKAGEAALSTGEVGISEMVHELADRVSLCMEALTSVPGVSVIRPGGAFYLFPLIEGLDDSFRFAVDLLTQRKVSVAPGSAFGPGGEGSIRICCAADRKVLEPAMERIAGFINSGK